MMNLVNVVNYALSLVGVGIKDEEGQGLVEYVLILALIAVVIVGAAATGLTTSIGTAVTAIGAEMMPGP